MGLPAELKSSLEESECLIWPQNWKTVQLFIALQTQWRTGMGGVTGLDYAALPTVARGEKIRLTPGRIRGVRVMESEALRVLGEARGRAAKNSPPSH